MTEKDNFSDRDPADTRTPPYTAIIIGGGPAGLFCACRAAGKDRRILVLEKMPSCGRKLCITGAGRCNLTHTGTMADFVSHYGGDGGKFLRPALMNFKNTDLLAFFRERGIPFTADENGKYFPKDGTAKDVLSVLWQSACVQGLKFDAGGSPSRQSSLQTISSRSVAKMPPIPQSRSCLQPAEPPTCDRVHRRRIHACRPTGTARHRDRTGTRGRPHQGLSLPRLNRHII